jgi:G3E family GTPase
MQGMMDVRALLIGGYDEPLKGTVIAEAARRIAVLSPESSLLVVRDHYEGVVGTESLGLKIDIEYLVGGCFCCSMKHDFELLLIEKGRKEGIRNFIVEVSLTAELETVKDTIMDVMGKSIHVTSIFAIDPSSAGVMMEAFPELMSRSLRTSDMVAIRRDGKEEINKLAMLGSEGREFAMSNDVGPDFDSGCGFILFSRRSLE